MLTSWSTEWLHFSLPAVQLCSLSFQLLLSPQQLSSSSRLLLHTHTHTHKTDVNTLVKVQERASSVRLTVCSAQLESSVSIFGINPILYRGSSRERDITTTCSQEPVYKWDAPSQVISSGCLGASPTLCLPQLESQVADGNSLLRRYVSVHKLSRKPAAMLVYFPPSIHSQILCCQCWTKPLDMSQSACLYWHTHTYMYIEIVFLAVCSPAVVSYTCTWGCE